MLGAAVDAAIVDVPCCVNDVGMTVVVVPLLVFWPLLGAVVAPETEGLVFCTADDVSNGVGDGVGVGCGVRSGVGGGLIVAGVMPINSEENPLLQTHSPIMHVHWLVIDRPFSGSHAWFSSTGDAMQTLLSRSHIVSQQPERRVGGTPHRMQRPCAEAIKKKYNIF